MSKTTVINLIGGPGTGKSTLAAELYAKMKRQGLDVEMVREVAKEWAYDGKEIGPFEQLCILGEQIKKESALFGKVKYVVTDSPVLLGSYYFQRNHDELFMNDMVKHYYRFARDHKVTFFNFILDRREKYNPKGRFESETDAILIDADLILYMRDNDHPYRKFNNHHLTNEDVVNIILKDVI